MQQKVLIVTPVALFEVVDGKTVERGNCACAVVGLPADRPRYSLVCYNDRRETLCVGSISSTNEHGLQFELQASLYASFRDTAGKRWSCMFLKESQMESFLAVLGIALYALAGQPAHATVIGDFAPPAGEIRLGLQHRVKVRYSAFAIRKGDVMKLGELLETNGDRPYNFQPVQSTMALHPEAKGFESSVLGMMEDTWRTVVVPATLPRSGGRQLYGGDSVIFVLQVVRILHDDSPMTAEAKVPAVFAATTDNASALVPFSAQTRDANGTKLVVLHSERREGNTGGDVSLLHTSACGLEGGGVPTEHIAMIQKLGAQIGRAITDARDVRDVAVCVTGEWKQAVNRPTPSALTNAALEQSVKQLIMENERVMDDITRRDELLQALDQRNRELQKRVDVAAMVSQQLLDENNDSVRTASDMKLEKERLVMKLQEQINQVAHERDDTQRHLETVKKLLGVSDEELSQLRGKSDVHAIQSESMMTKLNTTQDALAEERARRKGLEAKVMTLQEEIRNAESELHLKTAQLEELRRMADMERAHYAQIMEDERQRRGFEAHQLRSEIVSDLQLRDAKYQADRARVAEDNFGRGQAEGKEIGRREARIYVDTQLEELQLDAQRALTELDTSKTDLRRAIEEGMAQNRTLGAKVAKLKRQMYEETRKRVRLEFQLHGMRMKVRCARDNLMAAFTSAVYRLQRPAEVANLVQLLDAVKQRRKLDFSFEKRSQAAEELASVQRRLEWIESSMLSLYRSRAEAIYLAWVEPLLAEQKATVEAVRHLWMERDGSAYYELSAAETHERFVIGQAMELFFQELSAFFTEHMRQRGELFNDAERAYRESLEDYMAATDAIHAHRLGELQAWRELQAECMAARSATEEEQVTAFRCLLLEALTGMITADQSAFMEAEERERAIVDADQCAEFSGMLFDCSEGLEALRQLAAVVEAQNNLVAAEAQSRAGIAAAEGGALGDLTEEELRERPPPPPPPPPQSTVVEDAITSEGTPGMHRLQRSVEREGEEEAASFCDGSRVLHPLEGADQDPAAWEHAKSDSSEARSTAAPPSPPAACVASRPTQAAAVKSNLFGFSSGDDDDDAGMQGWCQRCSGPR
ncbi:hypothetical protein TraAM80_03754 [Trypanosoma rangeli]|uniref:Uncharacterized protein n=1 Tax=Trypanosoma rangeli TaxID=5698 RepID=A0A422NMN4_TRYRA|nr:uncharacterized protein TraAM80_03754 [Trypanosoma rangeli]RNF06731.1 hypothetical protein TraAM80_03754 [Trypanosoma rangeli]|eukprot:RNF06731.1 hypothetical protein TraAM80_03754 [Trypanosoma rangeli]